MISSARLSNMYVALSWKFSFVIFVPVLEIIYEGLTFKPNLYNNHCLYQYDASHGIVGLYDIVTNSNCSECSRGNCTLLISCYSTESFIGTHLLCDTDITLLTLNLRNIYMLS